MTAPIDLRSDTVTRPTPAMRRAMAEAEVGDDVYGEDPTVRALEERVAALLGKDAALFVPSGTQGNQIGLALHTRPGDEVLVTRGAHVALYESGAAPALSGLQLTPVGAGGPFDAEALRPELGRTAFYQARQSLLALENTHNHAGGLVFPQEELAACAALAREHALGVHLDGARLWNAAAASGRSLAELAAPADTISVCFSKGLGAPVGSALVLPAEWRDEAIRLRRRLG
ncbi:MAG TPA: threonine aldolase family protein, partial [Polyangiaceae bacterium LLY-WYZ-15_(1-7)]|nr:threonine aldolase family protein [Polyangiaceae bacterium LLY-WYZ-15_(1-7)]